MAHREMTPNEKKFFLNLLESNYTPRSLMKAMNEEFAKETGPFTKDMIKRDLRLYRKENAREKSQDDIEKGTGTDSYMEKEDDDTKTKGEDDNSEAKDKHVVDVKTEEPALILGEKEKKST